MHKWSAKAFREVTAKLERELDGLIAANSARGAMRRCEARLLELADADTGRSALERFAVAIAALRLDSEQRSMPSRQRHQTADLAEALLVRNGISSFKSSLAFLWAELGLLRSFASSYDGEHWQALVDVDLAVNCLGTIDTHFSDVLAVRRAECLLRLGDPRALLQLLERPPSAVSLRGRLASSILSLARLGCVEDFRRRVSDLNIDPSSLSQRHPLAYELWVTEQVSGRHWQSWVRHILSKGLFATPSGILDAKLWVWSSSDEQAEEIAEALPDTYAVKRRAENRKIRLSKLQSLTPDLEAARDPAVSAAKRIPLVGKLLALAPRLATIEDEILLCRISAVIERKFAPTISTSAEAHALRLVGGLAS